MSQYWIAVFAADGLVEGEAAVECDTDLAAVALGASLSTPFGHGLRSQARFLGLFGPGLARNSDDDDATSARPPAPPFSSS